MKRLCKGKHLQLPEPLKFLEALQCHQIKLHTTEISNDHSYTSFTVKLVLQNYKNYKNYNTPVVFGLKLMILNASN